MSLALRTKLEALGVTVDQFIETLEATETADFTVTMGPARGDRTEISAVEAFRVAADLEQINMRAVPQLLEWDFNVAPRHGARDPGLVFLSIRGKGKLDAPTLLQLQAAFDPCTRCSDPWPDFWEALLERCERDRK